MDNLRFPLSEKVIIWYNNFVFVQKSPKFTQGLYKQFLKQNKDSDIPSLIQNGNHYSSSDDKANVLNNFFSAQSTVDDTNATLPPFEPPDTSINEIVVSQEDVMDILKLLDTNKASGFSICLEVS